MEHLPCASSCWTVERPLEFCLQAVLGLIYLILGSTYFSSSWSSQDHLPLGTRPALPGPGSRYSVNNCWKNERKMENPCKGKPGFPLWVRPLVPSSRLWRLREEFDIIHKLHSHLLTTTPKKNIGFSLFWMTDPKDCSDRLGMTGLFASGPFPPMVYNTYWFILKTEQITGAGQEAELTNVRLLENEFVSDIWTTRVIANNCTPASGGLGDSFTEALSGSGYLGIGAGRAAGSSSASCHHSEPWAVDDISWAWVTP